MARLKGKTAVITGGSSGIGLATATLFIQEGAEVLITGRDQTRLDGAIAQLGSSATSLRCDQSQLADLDQLAATVAKQWGSLDILFINAGISEPCPSWQETASHFDLQININLKGPFFAVQKLLPMLQEGSSIIVNTSCLNQIAMEGMAVYSATKAGLRALVRIWALELASRKIRVNAIAPGPVETPIFNKLGLSPEQFEAMMAGVRARVPMHRYAQPEELAKAALFLASDEASFILGEELVVDGGMSIL